MITSIRLKNFKNFADETLRVGPFTILVGANASGKSNIRDAFRFLSGIGRGYSLAEIFGGKREAGWNPIRGAMNEIVRFGQETFSIEAGLKLDNGKARYLIETGTDKQRPGEFRVTKESLKIGKEIVYTTQSDSSQDDERLLVSVGKPEGDSNSPIRVRSDRPILGQIIKELLTIEVEILDQVTESLRKGQLEEPLAEDYLTHTERTIRITKALEAFSTIRFLDPSPDQMREPAFPDATVLGDFGENLPVVLQKICADPKRKEILAGWIAELTPMDVTGFEFPIDPSGRIYLSLCEKNGRKVSASSASDGTLRFLATLAMILGDNPNGLYFFEEIDTGIHPARQWLLLELIEKQAAKRGIQVITTTHAPDFLTFVNDSTFENMSVVCRLEDSQDAIIRQVAELPNAKKLRTSQGGLGRLLASRWMETTLAFTEDYDEAGDDQ